MTEPASADRIERVLVALDASAHDAAAFDALAQLAADLRAELHAVFVEDANLFGLIRLPFAHEIGNRSARERPFGRAELERSLRLRAARVRRSFEHAAGQRAIRFSFEVARGRVAPEALAAGRGDDLVVFRPAGLGPRFAGGHPARLRDRPVLIYLDPGSDLRRTLDRGVRLARAAGTAWRLVMPQLEDAVAARIGALALELAAAGNAPAIRLAGNGVEALARSTGMARAGMVVVSGASDVAAMRNIDALIAAIGCPLIVVR